MIYKIFNPHTGKYSTGGISPKFTSHGKTWTNERNLKGHLTLVMERSQYHGWTNPYENCVVLTLEMVAKSSISVSAYQDAIRQKKEEVRAAREVRRNKVLQKSRRKQYEALRKEFGS